MSAWKWMVVYPNHNYNVLTITQVLDYEQSDYLLASLKRFDEEKEAAIYARQLASENNLILSDKSISKLLHVLDLE